MAKIDKSQHQVIIQSFLGGESLREIGGKYGVSGEAIRKILIANNIPREQGGSALKIKREREAKVDARNRKYLSKYGCDFEQYRAINFKCEEGITPPIRIFQCQQNHARARGIQWKLTFWEWWCIWLQSGKWKSRGRGHGRYVMCRKGDEGAYEAGNVFIGTAVNNSIEGRSSAFQKGGKPGAIYPIVRAAGGRKLVALTLGFAPEYISQLCCGNHLPASWTENGNIEKLSSLTAGSYTVAGLMQFVFSPMVMEGVA